MDDTLSCYFKTLSNVPRSFYLRRLFFRNELRAAIGAGNKRTRATIGAPPERPFAKEFAAILPKSIEGSMNLKNTNAMPETKMLTHQGHSTSRLSIDSSFRAIKLLGYLQIIHTKLLTEKFSQKL